MLLDGVAIEDRAVRPTLDPGGILSVKAVARSVAPGQRRRSQRDAFSRTVCPEAANVPKRRGNLTPRSRSDFSSLFPGEFALLLLTKRAAQRPPSDSRKFKFKNFKNIFCYKFR